MSKMSKTKGQNGEYEVIRMLQAVIDGVARELSGGKDGEVSGVQLKRNLEQVRAGGADVSGMRWIEVEVKRRETLSVKEWWQQVVKASEESQKRLESDGVGEKVWPVLVYRKNREAWSVRMLCGVKVGEKWYYVPAVVTVETFLWWFRQKLLERMAEGGGKVGE